MKLGLTLLLLPAVLTGCMSTPRYQLNMSASELSQRIDSSTASTVNVQGRPIHSSPNSHVSVSGGYESQSTYSSSYRENGYQGNSSSLYQESYYGTGDGGFANNRVAIARRSTLNPGVSNYKVYGGYEVSFTGGDDAHQVRFALHGNDVDFQTSGTKGYNSPVLFGVDLDIHKIYSRQRLDFVWGARMSWALVSYNFDKPVSINDDVYQGDSIGLFGIGVPAGVQMNVGSLSLEAIATPTVYFHNRLSELGADNNIAFTNVKIPVSAGVGFNW